jgi:UvrD/REP helicase N-terminal domain
MTESPQSSFRPVEEQRHALELFLKGEGLRIDAYAGTGKTTTLQLLAASTPKKGLYLAFNRSIANEAQARFPAQVKCATSHSVAFHSVRKVLGYPEWKLTGTLSANLIVESFRMPEVVSFSCGVVLPKRSYASVLLDALKQFLQSAEETPQTSHIPRYGVLRALKNEDFGGFGEQAIKHVEAIWNAMQHKTAGLPLGHDGYLKLWALSHPQARTDYIMIDEAQDLNPVLLGVVSRLQCPIVYVGDPYQQIYEWRGAVNAMDAVVTKHYALLSQSFRFGPEIASAASVILRKLGAKHPLRGTSTIKSDLARVRPEAILARSNAGLIANVMKSLDKGLRCAVVGGTRELERLLGGVLRMKQGSPALVSELLGFNTWREVMSFSTEPEGEYLRSLVNLVQEHGENRMLAAVARCEAAETSAQVGVWQRFGTKWAI